MLDSGISEDDMLLMARVLGQSSHRKARAVTDVLSRAMLTEPPVEAWWT